VDDLKSGGDALKNIRDDSPLSNYVNADVRFEIHIRELAATTPCVLITATDGAFKYFKTPAHFEAALLAALVESKSDSWDETLRSAITQVASDDASLALVAIGFDDYEHLRASFQDRFAFVRRAYVDPVDEIDRSAQSSLDQHRERLAAARQLETRLWNEYRQRYEDLLSVQREEQS
jgi:hypothetical protein